MKIGEVIFSLGLSTLEQKDTHSECCLSLTSCEIQSTDISSAFLKIGECRALTQESCDISPVLAQAMEALQDRPVLYKYVIITAYIVVSWL